MNPGAISKKILQLKAVLLSVIFLVLIWLPTLDRIFHMDHAPAPIEKRVLAKFPEYKGLSQSRQFVAGLEQYFNDRFGFRNRLIRANNHWKYQLFRESPNVEVATGRNGWLYFRGGKTLDDYFGFSRFNQQELETWRQLLEKRRDWLAKRGIKYLFTIPPDKHSIYPEYLPDWWVKSDKPGKVDQFMEYMKAHSTVEVLDLRKPLLDAKPLGVIYLKTDTHWNFLGGFIGYQAVVDALSRQIPGLKPLPLDAFDRKPSEWRIGDLCTLMGDTTTREMQQVSFTPRSPLKPLKLVSDPARLPKQWGPNNEPQVSENDSGQGKAVVFRDSFANRWRDFLGYNFKEVIYIWQYSWDTAFLEREKPDVVIDEMLERFFNEQDPLELARKDQLSATNAPAGIPTGETAVPTDTDESH